MPVQKKMAYETSPGELYKGITSFGESFEGETKLVVERDPEFVLFCKKMNAQFPGMGKGASFTEKQKEAIGFLGWKLSAEELMAAMKGVVLICSIPIIILLVIIYVTGIGFSEVPVLKDLPVVKDFYYGYLTNMAQGFELPIFFAIALIFFSIIGAITYFIYSFPVSAAEEEKNKALTYVPEMVGYLIMSMKLVPNLEKAIEFSAKHGKGKVADDFKRLIWDFQIGVYSSISEGLDMMAIHWGKYSSELKEALMKIRASVMEPSESKRYQILDKTMLDVLESVKEKMGDYARSLNQPSVMLFYIGVLLPLLLVILLPVGSAFSAMPFATPPVLILVYCIAIPFLAFTFAKKVVKKRPPTYEPPMIDDNYAGLPKKWMMRFRGNMIDARMLAIGIIIIGLALSLFLSLQGFPPKFIYGAKTIDDEQSIIQILPADKQLDYVFREDGVNYYEKVVYDFYLIQITEPLIVFGDKNKGTYFAFPAGGGVEEGDYYKKLLAQSTAPGTAKGTVIREKTQFTSAPKNDATKYIFVSGIMLTLVLAGCFLLYQRNIYKRQAQLQIVQMEDEFKESMYMIASRMGENKPVENALKQAKDFLPNLMISQRIFGKTVENIELMGLPLENAIFDPVYGAMKGIPSKILATAMRLLVDSVNLGVEVASRTLMSLSLQMENMDKVNKSLKDMVSDVTTTMQTMALFIAPMVLGITTALQKVVMMTLASVVSSPEFEQADIPTALAGSTSGINMNPFKIDYLIFNSFASPLMYMVIIGIYVLMIVIILTYFTTKVKEDNDLLFKINLAASLPIAIAVYLVTTIASNTIIGSIMMG